MSVVVVQPVTNYTIVEPVTTAISISGTGQQGPQGIQGPQGPQGPSGVATGVFYTHTQNTPTATWVIVHNLGNFPTALVYDSSGSQCEGSIVQDTINQMTITFSAAFSGVAYII